MIDADLLRALGAGNSAAELYAPLLDEACPLWGIDTPEEVAGFLANCAHESARFAAVTENLNYSAQALMQTWPRRVTPELAARIARNPVAIANTVYANRMGNGYYASGDGWTFKGRGLIQVTGRANYEALATAWGEDCVSNPDLLCTPEGAVVSACWFWSAHGCAELAATKQWVKLREVINGGQNGLNEVLALTETAINYLGVQ